MTRKVKQEGFLLVVAIVLMVTVASVVATLMVMFIGSTRASGNHLASMKAFYLAYSGIERGRYALLTPFIDSSLSIEKRYSCANILGAGFEHQVVGEGAYTVTTRGTYNPNSAAAILTAAVTSTDTIIPMSTLTGYASSGRVMIDKEKVNYYGTSLSSCGGFSSPCLTNVVRGRNGSFAVAHAINTPVGQFQCDLQSDGGVPNLTGSVTRPMYAKRSVKSGVQLQKAWAVGEDSDDFYLFSWDGVGWTGQFTSTPGDKQNLYAISMLSYTDGWATGDNRGFVHWDGATWSYDATKIDVIDDDEVANKKYFGLSCIRHDLCFAVGEQHDKNNIKLNIVKWNGTIWRRDFNFTHYTDQDGHLKAISCVDNTFCATLGEKVEDFFGWDGSDWSPMSIETTGSYAVPGVRYYGIDCLTSNLCYAVGASDKTDDINLTILKWNGSIWQRDTAVQVGAPTDKLYAVTCVDATHCYVVGEHEDDFYAWDGATWSLMPRKLSGLDLVPDVDYRAIKCYTDRDCWAVGNYKDKAPTFVHWDGVEWRRVLTGLTPHKMLHAIDLVGAKQNMTSKVQDASSGWVEDFHSF